MSDLLVIAFGFLVFFQGAALLAWLALRLSPALSRRFAGSRGRWPLLGALALAALGATLPVLPHAFGVWTGHFHAATDLDLHRGAPAPWVLVLLGLFGGRVLWSVLRELAFSLRLRRARLRAIEPALAARLVRARARAAEDRLRIVLHRDPRLAAPFLRGVLRPTIVLHEDLVRSLSTEQLAAVLVHERAHARRGDHRLVWLEVLLLRPLTLPRSLLERWRTARAEAEFACDDLAAERLGSARTVAEAIVAVLRFAVRRRAVAAAVASFVADGELLRRRVCRLVDREAAARPPLAQPGATGSRSRPLLLLAAAAALLLWSWGLPQFGLRLFCSLEHAVGTHCL